MMVRRKSGLILGAIILALVMGLLLMLLSNNRQPLVSVTYLGQVYTPSGTVGRFCISNVSDVPVKYSSSGISVFAEGVWKGSMSPGPLESLQPHRTNMISFAIPVRVKWRGSVYVGQPRAGLASVPARLRWFCGQVRYGYALGGFKPTVQAAVAGQFNDGGLVKTDEIEN